MHDTLQLTILQTIVFKRKKGEGGERGREKEKKEIEEKCVPQNW